MVPLTAPVQERFCIWKQLFAAYPPCVGIRDMDGSCVVLCKRQRMPRYRVGLYLILELLLLDNIAASICITKYI